MKMVYIYCEGQTEESFINNVLYPYFFNIGIVVIPIICATKRTSIKKYKGGVQEYGKIKSELTKLCKSHRHSYVTTMFDYYGMPSDTPGIDCSEVDLQKRMRIIEAAVNSDIGEPNCMFHFNLHEFEALLFSHPESFTLITDDDTVGKLQEIRNAYETPEHINNSVETAPSKRIEALIPNYAKVKNGALLSKDVGIDAMLAECPHFREWVETIVNLS